MKNNWLKMYDKFGLVLRIETVINNPREFRVRRLRTRDGRQEMVWCPMNKGVCNLYHYREVALAANERYLDALSVVDDPAPAYRQVEELTEPVVVSGRSHAGFNPAQGSGREAVRCGAGWQPPGAWIPQRRHPGGAVWIDRGCRGTPSPEHRGGSNVEAVARARTDREGAAQPAVARQRQRPSSARSGGPTVSSWYPGGCPSSGVIHRKDARTAQRSYRGRIYIPQSALDVRTLALSSHPDAVGVRCMMP